MNDDESITDLMHYDRMVEAAMRDVVRRALNRVAEQGLPGGHHFYITFRTEHPAVEMAGYLRERYPEEMTIVLQHQFYGLEVDEECFRVTLSFNNMPEQLSVPYEAVSIFADPSVNFALQFQRDTARDPSNGGDRDGQGRPAQGKDGEESTGEVVSLDQFRRK